MDEAWFLSDPWLVLIWRFTCSEFLPIFGQKVNRSDSPSWIIKFGPLLGCRTGKNSSFPRAVRCTIRFSGESPPLGWGRQSRFPFPEKVWRLIQPYRLRLIVLFIGFGRGILIFGAVRFL